VSAQYYDTSVLGPIPHILCDDYDGFGALQNGQGKVANENDDNNPSNNDKGTINSDSNRVGKQVK